MELAVQGLFSSSSLIPRHYHINIATKQSRIICCKPGHQPYINDRILYRNRKKEEYRGLTSRGYRILTHASIDDEFRSTRNIALSLHRRYKKVVDGGFSNNIKDFISAGVTAYAIGCTDEGLRRELLVLRDTEIDSREISSAGSTTSVQLKLTSEEIEECILWLSIIFITILCTPQPTVVRWSRASPVSQQAEATWKGFCALIANAYYVRGMAWLPVRTLQLEQMAVMGHAEEPSLVADRMRIVFATLESVSPQWPKG